MSGSLNSQTPADFAAYLRKRAEEALSASVHHASLSQQYLTLSQKFAAIAEQAAGDQFNAFDLVRQLEREAATGVPAAPIGVQQITVSGQDIRPEVFRQEEPVSSAGVRPSEKELGKEITPEYPSPPASFFSPPAKVAASPSQPWDANTPVSYSVPDTAGPFSAEVSAAPSAQPTQLNTTSPTPGKPAMRPRSRRKKLSLRKLVERARLVALEKTERVRVRAKKSDLKPQIRRTSEELKQELKRGRGPAAVSTFVMILCLIVLALRQLEYSEDVELPPIVAGFSEKIEQVEESLPVEPPSEANGEQTDQPTEEPVQEMEEEPPDEPEPAVDLPAESLPEPVVEAPQVVTMEEEVLPETPTGTIRTEPHADKGADLSAVEIRSESGRKLMLEKYGGSAASESAVGFALEWLAARQRANGTWDFVDIGPCRNPGTVNNPIGGTAYALLPFLAAGQTHKEGQYRKQVLAGLEFLTTIGVRAPAGYDLRGVINKADDDEDPNYAYYIHGAATLALCEAYAMTKDRKLKPFAEEAAKFLVNSQDPRGGGWRYNPQQPGSTSATAMQVMALKAAEKAGIKIPDATWKGVSFYLDSVSVDGEGRYGYEVEKKSYGVSVTSMAMLSRMYLGWGRDDGDLRAGIALIDKRGPYDNLYYNYFATQVMKNWGGREWERWNGRLRDDLIAWQEKDGDSRGSWTPRDRDDYSRAGGRLLCTCLATLTLEVYYRYKPLLSESGDPNDHSVDSFDRSPPLMSPASSN